MQIIVIGCGKVGSRFANVLSKDGHDVVIVDNNSHGNPYYYTGPTDNDTIVLSDGDPGIGTAT